MDTGIAEGIGLPSHMISRVRHETRRRTLVVRTATRITPGMVRVEFASDDLDGFVSASPDDHLKFFPADSGDARRDYTPRAFDVAAGTLSIDFALHEAGPATAWAMRVAPGDRAEIGGPRGSLVVDDDFDWYWLIGDETALPAIGRRIEALRTGVPVTSIVAIDGADERQAFETRADWTPVWVERNGSPADDAAAILATLARLALPAGDGYVWIAAEASVARAVRAEIVARGHPPGWLKAAGYWTRGRADSHEKIGSPADDAGVAAG